MAAPPGSPRRRPLHTRLAFAAIAIEVAAASAWLGGRSMRDLLRSWRARVAVTGRSMEPTLRPGDWLLVDPHAFRARDPHPGELVVASDPRDPERLLVKRVRAVQPGREVVLSGDAPDRSTDSRDFGPVAAAAVLGRPWYRYWPPTRLGRVR